MGKEILEFSDGYKPMNKEMEIKYDNIKDLLKSDERLAKLSKSFENLKYQPEAQSEICAEIKELIKNEYRDINRKISSIEFEKIITDDDFFNWLQLWEPNIIII